MEGQDSPDGHGKIIIKKGIEVDIVEKQNQRSGELTRGIVQDILTNSSFSKDCSRFSFLSDKLYIESIKSPSFLSVLLFTN